MFFDDIKVDFKRQLEEKRQQEKIKEINTCLTNKEVIQYIVDYMELLKQDKFEILKKYINKRKEKMQIKKEKIDCTKYYCNFANYYELISVIYGKYKKTNNKQKFIENIWEFVDKKLIRYIHINNQYLVVEQFYKIFNNKQDIDFTILERWARSILKRMWWGNNNNYLYDYIWQTIIELKDKIKLDNWQDDYKSIFSYIYSYFRLAVSKVMKLDKVVDIPIDVLSCQYSNINEENESKVEKSKRNRLKTIYNKQTNSFNISSLDRIDSFIDLTWNWIDTISFITDFYIDFLNEHYKEQQYWFILEKYYLEGLWLKEIWKILWVSAERVRQKREKGIKILKTLENKNK